MDYKIKITSGLLDSKRKITPDELIEFHNNFVPRVGDTIVWKDVFWDVTNVVIDNDYNEIRIWVKDSERFK